ncbi:MAG: leucyl/phenylalanyl-tRNA--protein transferase [Cellvibrionaceae bacterium]
MTQLPWLDHNSIEFPSIENAFVDPNGLLAAGGDLSPQRLVEAYCRGIFPWYEDNQPILWWSPDPRLILAPDEIHISKSMAKILRKGQFRVTADLAFKEVICACSNIKRERQHGTWIINEMVEAYTNLHDLGHAHSIEVWKDSKLVGGLYGVAVGAAFFGESMFSDVSNASKIALISLSNYLSNRGYQVIDCQMETAHLKSMGAEVVSRIDFKSILDQCVTKDNKSNFYLKKWNLNDDNDE